MAAVPFKDGLSQEGIIMAAAARKVKVLPAIFGGSKMPKCSPHFPCHAITPTTTKIMLSTAMHANPTTPQIG